MKLSQISLLLFSSIIIFASCKKDNTESATTISGNYTFIGLTANTVSTVTYTDAGTLYKAITYSKYTTKNNKGSMQIDGSNMKSVGLSYSIDTTTKTDYFEDGELIDSFEMPLSVDVPSSNATTGYKIITNDSIYVSNGLMFSGSTSTSVEPQGIKYRKEGNRLILNAVGKQNKIIQQQGVSMMQESSVSAEIIYENQ